MWYRLLLAIEIAEKSNILNSKSILHDIKSKNNFE